MPRKRFTDEQKAEALRLYQIVGPTEAARRLKIPASHIRMWATRAGIGGTAGDALREELLGSAAEEGLTTKAGIGGHLLTTEQIDTISAIRRAEALAALEASRARQTRLREEVRELLLVKAKDALERMDQPHIEFKGKDATQVTYPKAPASAFQSYATSAAILLDKYRLEVGEATSRAEVELRAQIETLSIEMGLDPAAVWVEAERLVASGLDHEPPKQVI